MLTDAKVRTAKPRPKPYKLFDANRLFLLVAPGGGKLWRWNYTFDGKHKTMAFGAYPLSNFGGMGSGLVADGSGFMFQDRGQLFSLED